MKEHIILGIDPGSRCTGYAVICTKGGQLKALAHGFIRPAMEPLPERLFYMYDQLSLVIEQYKPEQAAVEQVFTSHNPQSALKLGQARGAILVACAAHALPTYEYSAREVKQAVVGYGAASKLQIQQMVTSLFSLEKRPQVDEADALAIALCHSSMQTFRDKISEAVRD